MSVGSDKHAGINYIPYDQTFEGYLRAFNRARRRLHHSEVGSLSAGAVAERLCRLSRFLLFAALRERVESEEAESASRSMRGAIEELSDVYSRTHDDGIRLHRDHIEERAERFRSVVCNRSQEGG